MFFIDVNECLAVPGICHRLANCSNVQGSYSCHCITGFSGDGRLSCDGKTSFNFVKAKQCAPKKKGN